jgi:FRG domain
MSRRIVPARALRPGELALKVASWRCETMQDGSPRYLFRGHTAPCFDGGDGAEIISSRYSRFPTDDEVMMGVSETMDKNASREWAIGNAYTILRTAGFLDGLSGYRHRDRIDTLAILQHYGYPTPMVDFSGTIDVALFFAFWAGDASKVSTPTLYVLDRMAAALAGDNAPLIVVDHDFLSFPFPDGLRVRWLRQDGFAVMASDWKNSGAARAMNLAAVPGLLQAYSLTASDRAQPSLSLLDIDGDPVAGVIRGLVEAAAVGINGNMLHPALEARIAKMPY